VWAGGAGEYADELYHWDGTAWTVVASLVDMNLGIYGLGPAGARGLWGTARDLWAVDRRMIARWDGTTWQSATRSVAADTLNAVWANSPTDVWAAGYELAHWDGTTWIASGSRPFPASAMWGSSPSDVWAVGGDSIAHFDGTTWSAVPEPIVNVSLDAVWGTAHNDVWVAGASGVFHWDGSAWANHSIDNNLNNVNNVTGLWGVADNDIWAVMTDQAAHWNGSSWTWWHLPGYSSGRMWGATTNDVWASELGYPDAGGIMLHWNGARWGTVGTTGGLNAIWGRASNDIWAGGASGVLAHWDGLSWTTSSAGADDLHGMHGAGGALWTVGARGAILRR
jgi:hypothetical protein